MYTAHRWLCLLLSILIIGCQESQTVRQQAGLEPTIIFSRSVSPEEGGAPALLIQQLSLSSLMVSEVADFQSSGLVWPSPNRQFLAYVAWPSDDSPLLKIIELESREILYSNNNFGYQFRHIEGYSLNQESLTWSNDSRLLAFETYSENEEHGIWLYDVDKRQVLETPISREFVFRAPLWNGDSTRLYILGADRCEYDPTVACTRGNNWNAIFSLDVDAFKSTPSLSPTYFVVEQSDSWLCNLDVVEGVIYFEDECQFTNDWRGTSFALKNVEDETIFRYEPQASEQGKETFISSRLVSISDAIYLLVGYTNLNSGDAGYSSSGGMWLFDAKLNLVAEVAETENFVGNSLTWNHSMQAGLVRSQTSQEQKSYPLAPFWVDLDENQLTFSVERLGSKPLSCSNSNAVFLDHWLVYASAERIGECESAEMGRLLVYDVYEKKSVEIDLGGNIDLTSPQ